MYRVIVPVAAILVVVAAGVAPASAYYPLEQYDTEIAAAGLELRNTGYTYSPTEGLIVSTQGVNFDPSVEYTLTLYVCPDDELLPGTPYGGACTKHEETSRGSFTGPNAVFSDVHATSDLFITLIVDPLSDGREGWSQVIATAGEGFLTVHKLSDGLPPVVTAVTCTVDGKGVIKPSLTGDTTECNTPIITDPSGGNTFTNLVVNDPPPPVQRLQHNTGGWPHGADPAGVRARRG